jgi:membrane protein
VLSFVAVILGASGLVRELKTALNTVWEVQPRPGGGLWGMVRDRFLSFALVLGVGFLLLVTLVISAALAALQGRFHGGVGAWATVFQIVGFVVDFVLTAFLIALIFKFVPDVRLRWRDVAPGAVVTAMLFTAGKFAIGAYLGRATVGSAYGAAGSLAIVLLWVYYSAQILLLGAELTQVWVRRRGRWIEPTPNADSTRAAPGESPAPAEAPEKASLPPPLPLPRPGSLTVMRVDVDAEPDAMPRVSPGYLGGLALGFLTGLVRDRLRIRSRQ